MSLKILALDLSLTATGVARTCGLVLHQTACGSPYHVDTWRPKTRGATRLIDLRDRTIATARGADIVIIEDGIVRSSAAKVLGELHGVIKVALHESGHHAVFAPPASVKKYATGRGNADKFAMLAAAKDRLGYAGESPDEADALWMLAMAADHHGQAIATMPAAHRAALAAIDWGTP